jgi:uncharacterized protein (DUF427 family)
MRAIWNGTVIAESDQMIVIESKNAAWTYPQPNEAAAQIKDHITFWKDVEVTE